MLKASAISIVYHGVHFYFITRDKALLCFGFEYPLDDSVAGHVLEASIGDVLVHNSFLFL